MSLLLAIDTSTDIASLALARDGSVLAELTWRAGQNHTTQMPPNLLSLFKTSSVTLPDLSGVIVAKGPGSFNGLRVGVSFAKGLAFGLSVPIAAVGTLEAAAYAYAETGLPVCPVLNAGRGEVATALYRRDKTGWRQLQSEHVAAIEALCAGVTERTLFCGDYLPEISQAVRSALGEKAVITSPVTDLRRAAYLVELGMERLTTGAVENVATFQPVYLRRPAITVAKHK